MPLPEVTALENTCVVETPSSVLNEAFRYAKDNIARCIRWHTLGWGMSAAPHRDTVVLGRDTAWNCLGADYVAPWFAPAALALFRDRQKPSGEVVVSVDMESGRIGEDDPGVSVSTPLYIRSVVERYRHYPSPFFREAFQSSVRRAADYLAAAVGPNGLISGGREGDEMAAAGESVASLNALSLLALRLTAEFTGESEYREAGDALAAAINEHLWDDAASLYRSGSGGAHALPRAGDSVFPLLAGIVAPERARRVAERLGKRDFQALRGMRSEQKGPVSPNLTLWYAAAVAPYNPEAALDALERIARPVATVAEAHEAHTNPGEFAERFEGDTGVRQGMALSPWVAPTFVWAVLQGVLGLTWTNGEPRFAPHWPDGWEQVTLRALPTGNGAIDVTLRRGEEYEAPGDAAGIEGAEAETDDGWSDGGRGSGDA